MVDTVIKDGLHSYDDVYRGVPEGAAARQGRARRQMSGDALLATHGVVKRFGGVIALKGVSFDLRPGRSTRCAARTAPANRRSSSCSAGSTRTAATRARSSWTASPRALRRRAMPSTPASPSFTRSSRSSPTCRSPRTCCSAGSRGGSVSSTGTKCTRVRARSWALAGWSSTPRRRRRSRRRPADSWSKSRAPSPRVRKVLVLDEPTAALASQEIERLLALVRDLRSRGIACIYISHKLDEVFAHRRPHHRAARRREHRHPVGGADESGGSHPVDGRAHDRRSVPAP